MLNNRNQLLPWYIGLVIILAAVIYTGYLFHATNCQAPGVAQFLVLIVVPAIYLVLMFITFRSQP